MPAVSYVSCNGALPLMMDSMFLMPLARKVVPIICIYDCYELISCEFGTAARKRKVRKACSAGTAYGAPRAGGVATGTGACSLDVYMYTLLL